VGEMRNTKRVALAEKTPQKLLNYLTIRHEVEPKIYTTLRSIKIHKIKLLF
jgi:hypothetical protein